MSTDAVLDRPALARTVATIAAVQQRDGNIPWYAGGHTDPWNLIEAAMALDAGGRNDAARRAFSWLQARQRPDGAWHWYYVGDDVEHDALDTNVTSYVATGVWHHYLATGDLHELRRRWPMVRAAIDFAVRHQREGGEIVWRGDDPDAGALLTASSSIHLSLRCAVAIAARLGLPQPAWALACARLACAIAETEARFLDRSRWSMDWYYPVLSGALTGEAAHDRLATRWDRFVVEGRGVRCVADQPWITVAETCELALALVAAGDPGRARVLYSSAQFLRADDGSYWTGANFEGDHFDGAGALYPVERTTWSAAAVVLAAHALRGTGPTHALFTGAGWSDRVTVARIAAGRAGSPSSAPA